MKDKIWKLKMLFIILASAYEGWKDTVWCSALDEPYCCDGQECSCDGRTLREYHEWVYANKN